MHDKELELKKKKKIIQHMTTQHMICAWKRTQQSKEDVHDLVQCPPPPQHPIFSIYNQVPEAMVTKL